MTDKKEIYNLRLEEVSYCPLCGQKGQPLYTGLSDRLYMATGTWNYVHCSRCGLIWLNPRPCNNDLKWLYANCYDYTEKFWTAPNISNPVPVAENTSTPHPWRRFLQKVILASYFGYSELCESRWKKNLGWLCGAFLPLRRRVGRGIMFLDRLHRGHLLEIGCGYGTTLSLMHRLGWEVTGVEPTVKAATIVRERFGLEVFAGTLEEAIFDDETFGAVTMNHVFEHLSNPILTLRECYRILKKEGVIVLATPNVKSLGHAIFRESWVESAPPWHLCLWSGFALCSCLKRVGFRISLCCSLGTNILPKWVASRLIQKNKDLDHKLLSQFASRHPTLWPLADAALGNTVGLLLGDELVVVAVKNS